MNPSDAPLTTTRLTESEAIPFMALMWAEIKS